MSSIHKWERYTVRNYFVHSGSSDGGVGVNKGRTFQLYNSNYVESGTTSVLGENIRVGSYINDGSNDHYVWRAYDPNGSPVWGYTYPVTSYTKGKGAYVDTVEAVTANAYPTNGEHTDGYWYVYIGEEVLAGVLATIDGVQKELKSIYATVDGVQHELSSLFGTVGGVARLLFNGGYPPGQELAYIQSNGTQYIDTGIKPSSNTRVVLEVEVTSSGTTFLFGARNNSSANAESKSFSLVQIGGTSLRSDFGSVESALAVSPIQNLSIDKNGNVTTINGTTVTATAQSFTSPYNLVIGTVNTAGTINSIKTSAKWKPCKIYEAGVLVRDYVPYQLATGENGYLDKVNKEFYGNAGTGEFTGKVAGAYDPVFANNSWADIVEACQTGNVPDTWAVGDQKEMKISYNTYLIDIIGKNHDTYADGSGKAPLTFQMHDCYSSTYVMGVSNTNVGGWESTSVRKSVLPGILKLMPSEVQAGIKEVSKRTSAGNASDTIITTAEKLFLLSEVEIFGAVTYSKSGEGTQYDYYKAGNSKVKILYSANAWWQRSPWGASSANFCAVNNVGNAAGYGANTSIGIAFAFCF